MIMPEPPAPPAPAVPLDEALPDEAAEPFSMRVPPPQEAMAPPVKHPNQITKNHVELSFMGRGYAPGLGNASPKLLRRDNEEQGLFLHKWLAQRTGRNIDGRLSSHTPGLGSRVEASLKGRRHFKQPRSPSVDVRKHLRRPKCLSAQSRRDFLENFGPSDVNSWPLRRSGSLSVDVRWDFRVPNTPSVDSRWVLREPGEASVCTKAGVGERQKAVGSCLLTNG